MMRGKEGVRGGGKFQGEGERVGWCWRGKRVQWEGDCARGEGQRVEG